MTVESLQAALSHGLGIAARISYKIFQSVILKALFFIDEAHLEMAIEQDVDLLPLFMIYAPQWVKYSRDIAGRFGRGYEHKITLENSLKWLKEQCERRRRGYYDIIVNTPNVSNVSNVTNVPNVPNAPNVQEVFPPQGADMKRVMWFWNNVQRLTGFIFRGEVPESSRKWGVEHLKWLAKQKEQGRTQLNELLEEAQKEAEERKQNG